MKTTRPALRKAIALALLLTMVATACGNDQPTDGVDEAAAAPASSAEAAEGDDSPGADSDASEVGTDEDATEDVQEVVEVEDVV